MLHAENFCWKLVCRLVEDFTHLGFFVRCYLFLPASAFDLQSDSSYKFLSSPPILSEFGITAACGMSMCVERPDARPFCGVNSFGLQVFYSGYFCCSSLKVYQLLFTATILLLLIYLVPMCTVASDWEYLLTNCDMF